MSSSNFRMCENCFTEEIQEFISKKIWDKFDLDLSQKLSDGKIIQLEYVHDGLRDKDDGEYIYECVHCGERWKLREPSENFGGGYFLRLSTKRTVSIKVYLWILIIAIIIILVFLLKK